MKKVIAYKEFKSKKGADCRIITVSEEINNPTDKIFGVRVEDVFLPNDCALVVTPKDLGREVVVAYDIQGTYARVSDIRYK